MKNELLPLKHRGICNGKLIPIAASGGVLNPGYAIN
jgi:hypothetical protein